MRKTVSHPRTLVPLAVLGAVLLGLPATGTAQTLAGNASAIRATTIGLFGATTTELAGTGSLSSPTDARESSRDAGAVSSLVSGETLHATTIGWPDQVASEASLAGLELNVAGTTIGADFVMARARAAFGAAAGASNVDNLSINGMPFPIGASPNQRIPIAGGEVVVNEQQASAGGIAVNALHVIVYGVADVVVGSATAAVQ